MEKLNQENTNFNKIDMNAQEARKMAEEFEWTPEIDETIELIKKSANRGEFSTTTNRMKPSTQRYLEREGYKVRWHDVQRDGYWEVSW
ncbi:MAG: hypothetical protein RLZ10_2493 [Bacteroidota bacterium]|jgi:hypothetical protein